MRFDGDDGSGTLHGGLEHCEGGVDRRPGMAAGVEPSPSSKEHL